MLRPIEPDEPSAYPVPWAVVRGDRMHPLVTYRGSTPADFVRVFHDGFEDRTQLWGQMLAGEQVEMCLCRADPDDVVVTLAWFRQEDGLEYLWRFVV